MKCNFIVCCLVFLLLGCQQETCCDNPEETEQINFPGPEEFENLRSLACDMLVQEHIFMAEEGTQFTSEEGVVIQVFQNCFTFEDGSPVVGEVTLRFIEIYQRADMLLCNKTTLGLNNFGSKQQLITAGIFLVEFYQNNQKLQNHCEVLLAVPVENSGGAQQEMMVWSGETTPNHSLLWQTESSAFVFVEAERYQTFVVGLNGWISIAKLPPPTNSKTTVQVLVSRDYHFENAAVYLAYSGQKYGLSHLDVYDINTHTFDEFYNEIPVGENIHLIFVTADDNQWRYQITSFEITESQIIPMLYGTTQKISQAELKAILNQLD